MHAMLYGVSRDQLMAKHQANHIQVAYAPDARRALEALATKAAMARALGIAREPVRRTGRFARSPSAAGVPVMTAQPPCALGLDFGTASVRAVLVDTQTGAERGASVSPNTGTA